MRRRDREITDREAIDGIIRCSRVCHLALCDAGQPYVIPLSFGYDGASLFCHGAGEGRKVDMLRKNNKVCFQFEILSDMIPAKEACRWGLGFESVIGFGRARFLEEGSDKRMALNCIMRQYSQQEWTFTDEMVSKTLVIRIDIDEITGKRRDTHL
jgi:uncharacterized protein